jgi:hypothetical protein
VVTNVHCQCVLPLTRADVSSLAITAVAHGLMDGLRALGRACEHVGDRAFGNFQAEQTSGISARRA